MPLVVVVGVPLSSPRQEHHAAGARLVMRALLLLVTPKPSRRAGHFSSRQQRWRPAAWCGGLTGRSGQICLGETPTGPFDCRASYLRRRRGAGGCLRPLGCLLLRTIRRQLFRCRRRTGQSKAPGPRARKAHLAVADAEAAASGAPRRPSGPSAATAARAGAPPPSGRPTPTRKTYEEPTRRRGPADCIRITRSSRAAMRQHPIIEP